MSFKTFFYGGMEILGKKERTISGAIANAALPNVAIVPLSQHRGPAAEALVAIGDVVKESMPIGRSRLGALIHSPIPGIVQDIRDIILPDGKAAAAIVIGMSGGFDRTGRTLQHHDWAQLTPDDLITLIRDMGVSGLGNTAMPTHLKLQAAQGLAGGVKASRLVINAMESEPFQTADFRILEEKTGSVLEAVRIVQHILGGVPTTLALSSEYRQVQPAIRKARQQVPVEMNVQVLQSVFPQGDDRLLSQALFRIDPARASTNDSGEVLVLGVSTLFAIFEAVVLRKPLIERVVTISGDALNQPMNLRVRIGTPISWLIEECGGLKYLPDRIVIGGPLTGQTILDPDTPVTKQTRAILALGEAEVNHVRSLPCIRCGACVRVCPAGLQPLNLAKLVVKGELGRAVADDLDLCSECGLCSFTCPSRVPLVRIIREGKSAVAGQKTDAERKTPWPSQVY